MGSKVKISRSAYRKIILLTGAGIILTTLVVVAYLITYKANEPAITSLPTPKPTATPTPPYLPFLNKPASFVGTVEEISGSRQITVLRDDGSRLILTLKPKVPIYVVKESNAGDPIIDIMDQSILKPGATVSIYTKDDSIVAIFLINDQ